MKIVVDVFNDAGARPDLYREIRDTPPAQLWRRYDLDKLVISAIGNPCAYSSGYLLREIGIYARKLRKEKPNEQVINAAP
jgi:hypothetical protein